MVDELWKGLKCRGSASITCVFLQSLAMLYKSVKKCFFVTSPSFLKWLKQLQLKHTKCGCAAKRCRAELVSIRCPCNPIWLSTPPAAAALQRLFRHLSYFFRKRLCQAEQSNSEQIVLDRKSHREKAQWIRPIFKIKQMSKQNTLNNDSVVVLSVYMYIDICQQRQTHTRKHTHTHTQRESSRELDIWRAEELVDGVEKCASGVDWCVCPDGKWHSAVIPPPVCPRCYLLNKLSICTQVKTVTWQLLSYSHLSPGALV